MYFFSFFISLSFLFSFASFLFSFRFLFSFVSYFAHKIVELKNGMFNPRFLIHTKLKTIFNPENSKTKKFYDPHKNSKPKTRINSKTQKSKQDTKTKTDESHKTFNIFPPSCNVENSKDRYGENCTLSLNLCINSISDPLSAQKRLNCA